MSILPKTCSVLPATILLVSLLLSGVASGQKSNDVPVKDFSHETAAEKAKRMEWFQDARFGMFIHWGLYAQPAGVWKGKDIPSASEWIQLRAKIPVSEYSQLQTTFNPTRYDPEAWVRLAKEAGMKYIVITSKHHDGFCLFDSQETDWDIGGTPYKKDLLKPLAEACRKHGLKICFYYSIMDWHHPQYGTKDSWRGNHATEKPDMEAYRAYMKNQLRELLTEYGDIGIVWFDGEWEKCWTHEMGVDLYNYCRTLQPNTIVNNRVDKGRKGMAGMTQKGGFVGDYGTPEQEIPATGFGPGVYWESCMTMNRSWGFKAKDHQWKSAEKLIRNLIDIASKGGNFLLNVGPTAEGEIPPASVERLQAIGKWMKTNGESIHGTSANPLEIVSWNGRCTQKKLPEGGTRLYLHVFQWPRNGKLNVKTLKNRPIRAGILGSDQPVAIGGKEGDWELTLPHEAPDKIATVITLDLEGDVQVLPHVIEMDSEGIFNLDADQAKLSGPNIRIEHSKSGANHIGFWTDKEATVHWPIQVPQAQTYQPVLRYACADDAAGSQVAMCVGDQCFTFTIQGTGGWKKFKTLKLDPVQLKPGPHQLELKVIEKPKYAVMNLQSITLTPQK